MIRVSAPGKIYLAGEHAVVYGYPGILAAVDLRLAVLAEKSQRLVFEGEELRIEEVISDAERAEELWREGKEKSDFSELFSWMKTRFRRVVLGMVLKELGISEPVSLKLAGTRLWGVGLGSSAALALSVCLAVAELFGKKLRKERLNEIAFKIERLAHGSPSGGDNTAICWGGFLRFQKGVFERIELDFRPELLLVNTGKPERTTGELVQAVRQLPEDFRNPRLERIGKITDGIIQRLREHDMEGVAELMRENQKILAEFGLSTPKIDRVCRLAEEAGGAGKLSGAGGGGIVVCWSPDLSGLQKKLENEFQVFRVKLGADGVRVD